MRTILASLILPAVLAGAARLPAQAGREDAIHEHDWTIVQEQGSHRLRIEDRNGEVSVTLDGKAVPEDRILRRDGRIIVLDEDGDELLAFPEIEAPAPPSVPQPLSPPPRKRIGVTLGQVGEALAEWAGVDPDKCCLVTSVLPGSPAEEAGIRPHDIIVGIHGRDTATMEDLQEAVASCPDGESLRLEILRRGERLSVEVRPRVEDESEDTDGVLGMEPWLEQFLGEGRDDLEKPLEEALESLREAERQLLRNGSIQELRKKLEEELRRSRRTLEEELKRLRDRDGGTFLRLRPRFRFFDQRPGPGFLLVPPEPPAVPDGSRLAERLEQLAERLEGIEQRLEHIEDLLRDRLH